MKHKNIAIFVPHAGCPHRCTFCDQRTITAQQTLPHGQDVVQICTQAFSEIPDLSETEIAFFGGSFTAIPQDYMLELLQAASPFAARCSGIRISTRPDCIDSNILTILKQYHVTAIELGAQSLDDRVLYLNERGHTAQDVYSASALIRENGFELGLQVMPGLYGADVASDQRTAEAVCRIRPDTVRIYPVVILKGTRLGELYESGVYRPVPFAEMVRCVSVWCEMYRTHGIRIIKVGLHAGEFVAQNAIGGYYHPAFRELCESYGFRCIIETGIARPCISKQDVTVYVHPSCISKAVGQKRENLRYFSEKYGIRLRICPDENVRPAMVRFAGEEPENERKFL
ncbi:MAG: radical SAM protein [Oscillospiraceae bacterium]|nr:radical SAM protein [Oscillospiraceae bacterium]